MEEPLMQGGGSAGEVHAEFGCPALRQPVSKLGKAVHSGLLGSGGWEGHGY